MSTPVFFESILYFNHRFPFLNIHFQRIQELATFLHASFPHKLEDFHSILLEFIENETIEQKLKVTFSLNQKKLICNAVETIPILQSKFNSNPAIDLVIYPHYKKPREENSAWKYENPNIYVDSLEFASKIGAHQSIILNDLDDIVETTYCNFFYLIKNRLFTPPLSSGSVNGVFRRHLMSMRDIIIREKALNINEIHLLDACFITSAVRGIIPVKKINTLEFQLDKVLSLRNGLLT